MALTFSCAANKYSTGLLAKAADSPRKGMDDGMCGGSVPCSIKLHKCVGGTRKNLTTSGIHVYKQVIVWKDKQSCQ